MQPSRLTHGFPGWLWESIACGHVCWSAYPHSMARRQRSTNETCDSCIKARHSCNAGTCAPMPLCPVCRVLARLSWFSSRFKYPKATPTVLGNIMHGRFAVSDPLRGARLQIYKAGVFVRSDSCGTGLLHAGASCDEQDEPTAAVWRPVASSHDGYCAYFALHLVQAAHRRCSHSTRHRHCHLGAPK